LFNPHNACLKGINIHAIEAENLLFLLPFLEKEEYIKPRLPLTSIHKSRGLASRGPKTIVEFTECVSIRLKLKTCAFCFFFLETEEYIKARLPLNACHQYPGPASRVPGRKLLFNSQNACPWN
jgi:hypothetical protein